MLESASDRQFMRTANSLVERVVHSEPAISKRGLLERLFTVSFRGIVYTHVWEDPVVDLAALALGPAHVVLTISSAGCNLLNYLTESPARILSVDVNPHHLALTRLKIASLKHLPSYDAFFSFWGVAADRKNLEAYDTFIKPHLDADARRYWEAWSPVRGRRIDMFANNLYRHGILGRGIGLAHWLARLRGQRLEEVIEARNLTEQRDAFDRAVAPLFDNVVHQALAKTPVPLFVLGIPPAQYDELVAASGGELASLLRSRIEKLACAYPVSDNYFAWQVFARRYDVERRQAIPPYLRRDVYESIRSRVDRIDTHHAPIVDFLERQPPRSIHRFVLLDAQDWMTPGALAALWTQINRTADRHDARVIFRTAGATSILPRKLSSHLFESWQYRDVESRELHARDRASIFGGFHLYTRS
jgi:S-adenosylmethionine-diacylglycerol 3-amino-3-carboxypropyl transferase